jgi:two-component system chemotaxis response regulator CheY
MPGNDGETDDALATFTHLARPKPCMVLTEDRDLWATMSERVTVFSKPEKTYSLQDLKDKFKAKYGYDLGVPVNWSAYEDIAEFFTNQLGFQVVGIGQDGNEAVDLYRKHKPDLVTMDLTMPNKDGKTAIGEILKDHPEARIMVISAVKGNTMLECMKMGAKGYVEKPLKFSDPVFVDDFKASIDEVFNA